MPRSSHSAETREQATARMVPNPDSWPSWPLLPLKNNKQKDANGFARLGCLYGDGTIQVFLVNMFEWGKKPLDQIEHETYANVDALIRAGWLVD
jgi:hypothetical protein